MLVLCRFTWVRSRAAAKQQEADYQAKMAEPVPAGVTVLPLRTLEASCAMCGTKENKLLACGKCREVQYCGKECQKGHWKAHKPTCNNV